MKKLNLLLLAYLPIVLLAQKEDHVWVLGGVFENDPEYDATVVDFNEIPPVFGTVGFYPGMYLTNTSICDSNGNLLLYSNGRRIFNSSHNIILNGNNFAPASPLGETLGHNAFQGAMFFPRPAHPDEYVFVLVERKFFFDPDHGVNRTYGNPLTYSIINTVTGFPIVTKKKAQLSTDSLFFGGLTGVRHGNGEDWWLIAPPSFGGNVFRKFLLTKDTFSLHDEQVIGPVVMSDAGQQAVLSPDGNWLAIYTWHGENLDEVELFTSLHLYRFDRCSGLLSEDHHLVRLDAPPSEPFPSPDSRGGVAFSPDSKLLYMTNQDTIFQYDLVLVNPLQNATEVAIFDGFVDENGFPSKFSQMKLAPDGKIYILSPALTSKVIHVIEQPNLKGIACGVQQHSLILSAYNYLSLPHRPIYHPTDSVKCDSMVNVSIPLDVTSKITVFPNPCREGVNVIISEYLPRDAKVMLYDAVGQRCRVQPVQTGWNTVRLDGLRAGIYFYEIWERDVLLDSGKLVKVE